MENNTKKQFIGSLEDYVDKSNKQIYVAFDIETGGAGFQHPVIAVGVCYGNVYGYYKKRWCIEFNTNDFEKKCYEEFWTKHEDILDDIRKEAVDSKSAWNEIGQFLDRLSDKYPNSNIVILSDNPAFDLSRIDYELFTRLGRLGCRHIGKYRRVMDPTEQRTFFPRKVEMKELVKKLAPHTHYPDDDAEGIFLQQIILNNPKLLDNNLKLPKIVVTN
jgi:hypothetical protein